ncbi:hypothetical protein CPB84DRAFT_688187 [Gymnopilus junonius]|uniref:Uncharacterized protein n=1 Tax=Gymnopilus junonius TaxID=109634 RepID=A0A9P5N9C1_GYMJU|nr:hypothetical protein CPB84DRAFT_688187 [Gymnopilus junonius]
MSIFNWLQVLQCVPCLESLCLVDALPDPTDPSTSTAICTPVRLSKLSEIKLDVTLRACAIFLEHVMHPAQCHLFLSASDSDKHHSPAGISLVTKALTRYTQNFLDSHTPTSLSFFSYDQGFRISDNSVPEGNMQKGLVFFISISSPAMDKTSTRKPMTHFYLVPSSTKRSGLLPNTLFHPLLPSLTNHSKLHPFVHI